LHAAPVGLHLRDLHILTEWVVIASAIGCVGAESTSQAVGEYVWVVGKRHFVLYLGTFVLFYLPYSLKPEAPTFVPLARLNCIKQA